MKKAITILKKAALAVILLFVAQASYADNYYAYKGKEVTINGGGTFSEYRWTLLSQPDGTTNNVINGSTTSELKQTFTTAGLYKLRVEVRNGDGCWSDPDPTKDIDIFVLPDFTVAVNPDIETNGTYCQNATTKTTLTASATPDLTLPGDVSVDLAVWFKATSVTGDLATATQVAATGTTYIVNETTTGTHFFTATGKYIIPVGRLISATNDPVQSNIATITVTEAPTTPTINPVIANNP